MAREAVKVSQPDAAAETITRGCMAWAELKKSRDWQHWVSVGEALVVGRAHALRQSGSTEPFGRGYTTVFGSWLHTYGFDEIDQVTRHQLLKLMEPGVRGEIENWRASLTASERSRCNHPSTMMRFLEKTRRARLNWVDANADLEAQIEKLVAALQTCRAETARLKAENAELKAKLKET